MLVKGEEVAAPALSTRRLKLNANQDRHFVIGVSRHVVRGAAQDSQI
jgi:hypothetical protein